MKLDMTAAWNDAVAMINANREVMAVIAGVFFFLPSLAAVFLLPTIETLPQGADLEEVRKFLIDFYSANAVPFILMGLAQAVGFISLLALLRDDRKPTVGEAIKNGFVGLLPYIGVELIIAFGAAIVVMVLVGIPVAHDQTVAGHPGDRDRKGHEPDQYSQAELGADQRQ